MQLALPHVDRIDGCTPGRRPIVSRRRAGTARQRAGLASRRRPRGCAAIHAAGNRPACDHDADPRGSPGTAECRGLRPRAGSPVRPSSTACGPGLGWAQHIPGLEPVPVESRFRAESSGFPPWGAAALYPVRLAPTAPIRGRGPSDWTPDGSHPWDHILAPAPRFQIPPQLPWPWDVRIGYQAARLASSLALRAAFARR